jgi:drug/metabolite transporter (DMT)-like permease
MRRTSIVNKFVVDEFSTSETMFWHGVVAPPLLAAFVPAHAWSAVDPRRPSVSGVHRSVARGTFAGLVFIWALRRMPAAHASTLTLLEPLVAVLLGGPSSEKNRVFGRSWAVDSSWLARSS